MSWSDLAIKKTALVEGSFARNVDANNDGNPEATLEYTKDSKSLFYEKYDFDSNGALDYTRARNKDGSYKATIWTNNPENNMPVSGFWGNVKELFFGKIYSSLADELSAQAESSPLEYQKGAIDCTNELLELSQAKQELTKEELYGDEFERITKQLDEYSALGDLQANREFIQQQMDAIDAAIEEGIITLQTPRFE